MVETHQHGVVHELPVDEVGTVAVFRLPNTSIPRSHQIITFVEPTGSIDFSFDTGIRRSGDDSPDDESDLKWYEGIISKNVSDGTVDRTRFETGSNWIRMTIDSEANPGDTADVALMVGRT